MTMLSLPPLDLPEAESLPRRTRLVFLGSKDIGADCLSFLLETREESSLEIVCVLTSDHVVRSAGVRRLCDEHDLPVLASPEALHELEDVDFLISVQYHKILSKADLAVAGKRAINLHMAPIPEYRGCNQFSFAILNQASFFGTTLHVMDERIDHGEILAEDRFEIADDVFVDELLAETVRRSKVLFREWIVPIMGGRIPGPEGDPASRDSNLYFRSDIEEAKQISGNWPSEKIARHIRATAMPGFPGPELIIGSRSFRINSESKSK
jgi:methionyl-tRNA formyltransferase